MDRDATPTARVSWQGRSLTDAVLDVEVEDHDRLSDRAVIELSDPGGMIASIVLPGHSIAVELGSGAATTTVFTGIVRGSTCHTSAEYGDRISIEAFDRTWLLHQERRTEDHVGSINSIVTAIAQRHALVIGQIEPDDEVQYPETNPYRQHDRTDLEAIQDLAERHRARTFVERNDGADRFYFIGTRRLLQAEPLATLHAAPHGNLVEFRYEYDADAAAPQLRAAGLDARTGDLVQALSAAPDQMGPMAIDPARRRVLEHHHAGLGTAYQQGIDEANAALPTAPHPQPMTSHGGITDRLAASLAADPTAARGARGWGQVGGTPELRAKSIVEIDGIAPWACGRWYVAAATHRYRAAAGGGSATYATHLAVTR